MPPQIEYLLVLVILLVGAGFFAIMVWALFAARRKAGERRQRLLEQGFAPLDPPDEALIESIAGVYAMRPNRRVELRDVYQRPIPGGRLFLFDAWDVGGRENDIAGRGVVALQSPSLDLPPFMLWPLPEMGAAGGGFLARAAQGLMDRALDWAATYSGMQRYRLADLSTDGSAAEFDEHYLLFGRDPSRLGALFARALPARLASLGSSYALHGAGDLLFVEAGSSFSKRPSSPSTPPDDAARVSAARKIFAWFQEAG